MSNYTKTTNFGAKDTLPSGDSQKIIRGTEFDTEFNNVATAIATKLEVDGSNNLAISGTFSSTKLIPTGGTATGNGLYLPAANTVALSTNGTERVRVDSSGNLGVGRTPSGSAIVDVQNDANAIIRVRGGAGSNEGSAFYGVSGSDTTRFAFGQVSRILGGTPNDDAVVYAAGYLAFAAAGSERARIDTSGNLGIGTTSPGSRLDVQSASSANAYRVANIYNSAATGTTAGSNILLRVASNGSGADSTLVLTDSTSTNGFISNNNGNLLFGNGLGFTERMRLDSSGKLGIGTASPAYSLDVNGAINASADIISQGNNARISLYRSGGINYFDWASGQSLYFSTQTSAGGGGRSTKMTLDSSGNLGLGVTPSAWGDTYKVSQIGAGGGLWGRTTTTTQVGITSNVYNDNSVERYIGSNFAAEYLQASGAHYWYTAPSGTAGNAITFTQAMTLTSGGDLLVGTTGSYAGHSARQTVCYDGANEKYGITLNAVSVTSNATALSFLVNGTTSGSGGTAVGSVTCSGSATAYNTSSDYRLKDNPQPLTNSGTFIDALQPKTWDWKIDGSRGVGFIAHEVQAVSPSSVVGTKDAVDAEGKPVMQGMEYGSAEFIANIVAELQSLRARVATLENN